ncbi:MAG: hypothetical protein ABWK05_05875 [Pyrobaculum sp.]
MRRRGYFHTALSSVHAVACETAPRGSTPFLLAPADLAAVGADPAGAFPAAWRALGLYGTA